MALRTDQGANRRCQENTCLREAAGNDDGVDDAYRERIHQDKGHDSPERHEHPKPPGERRPTRKSPYEQALDEDACDQAPRRRKARIAPRKRGHEVDHRP